MERERERQRASDSLTFHGLEALGYTAVRALGLGLFLVGLLATIVCTMHGCGTFFSWNGRHTVQSQLLTEEHAHATFTTRAGLRYTLSVQAVFDPAFVDDRSGMAEVELKMPLVVKAKDSQGTTLAEVSGWLERDKPNIFYSRPLQQPGREIMVERLVGPFYTASIAPVGVDVDLGPDRVGRNVVTERRLVVYDDALPPPIRNAVIGAVTGAIALIAGFVLLLLNWRRGRTRSGSTGGRRKRSGIPG